MFVVHGFLTNEKLEREAGGANRSYLRTTRSQNAQRQAAAYVSSFNGVLAALAVGDALQLLLGYAPSLSVRKQYDALSGTTAEIIVQKNPPCAKCSSVLATGDPLWQ
jgi:hypothetical protein